MHENIIFKSMLKKSFSWGLCISKIYNVTRERNEYAPVQNAHPAQLLLPQLALTARRRLSLPSSGWGSINQTSCFLVWDEMCLCGEVKVFMHSRADVVEGRACRDTWVSRKQQSIYGQEIKTAVGSATQTEKNSNYHARIDDLCHQTLSNWSQVCSMNNISTKGFLWVENTVSDKVYLTYYFRCYVIS